MKKNEERKVLDKLDRLEALLNSVVEKLDRPKKLNYTLSEAAEAIGISPKSMYNLINREDFPSLRVGDRRLINRKLLEKWGNAQARGMEP